MGKNMLRLLKFAVKYRGWQSYGKDRSTVEAVRRLARMELLELNEHRQFRLKGEPEVVHCFHNPKQEDNGDPICGIDNL